MLGSLTTLLSFAFVLGVLVFVHELGHFFAAKRVGVKVLKFQLGFNPTILKVRRGDTEYSLGALPLGGYVKMAGDNPEEGVTGASYEFLSKTKWERFQVLIMGPVMNLALAVILAAVVAYQGIPRPAYQDQPVVVGVVERNSAAEQVGLTPGDRIVSVGGRDVPTWRDFEIEVATAVNRQVALVVERGGERLSRNVTPAPRPDSKFEVGEIGILPNVHPHIRSVVAGEPAAKAGLLAHDIVVAVNDEPMTFSTDLRAAITKNPETPISLSLLRNGAPTTISATPARFGAGGRLGIEIGDDVVSIKPGVVEAMKAGVDQNVEMAGMIFRTLGGLFTMATSPKQLMGPVAMAQLSGEAAQLGWIPIVALMWQFSLNLGLLNLMPIPILDGGHIFIMFLEGLARRDLSVKLKERMMLGGFVVLMSLMVTVIYNDLTRISWIERLMPWR
ncbi:MAG: RIP metalloprotease RseP [Vicinamibacterales bacterium]